MKFRFLSASGVGAGGGGAAHWTGILVLVSPGLAEPWISHLGDGNNDPCSTYPRGLHEARFMKVLH